MEKNRFIERFTSLSDRWSLVIEGYIVPSHYIGQDGSRVDLASHRRKLLEGMSSFENSFIYDVSVLVGKAKSRKNLYNYIREFPVVISDRKLWEEILEELGIEKGHKGWKTGHFMLDFVFHWSGFIVEIDSSLHDPDYDRARDEYIWRTLGLHVIRFYEYGKDKIKRAEFQGIFKFNIKSAYWRSQKQALRDAPILLDFRESVAWTYSVVNKESLLFIDSLIRYIGRSRFRLESEIVLGKSDLMKICPKRFKGPSHTYKVDDLFILSIRTVLMEIYHKDIKVI